MISMIKNIVFKWLLLLNTFRLKHGIGADQDFFMLYNWYRKNIQYMNKFYKLTRLTENFNMLALPIADI